MTTTPTTTTPDHQTDRKKWPPTTPSGNGQGHRGLACRACGCSHLDVIYTRPAPDNKISRRRQCRHCGKRMTTWETANG